MDELNAASLPPQAALERAAREAEIQSYLLERYGPLLTRDALAHVLGFSSATAFDRYWQRGHLQLTLVKPPSRRGVFAHARDVARYLAEIPQENAGYKRETKAS